MSGFEKTLKVQVDNAIAAMQKRFSAHLDSHFAILYKERMTVNEWTSSKIISDNDTLTYPNAKTAAEIKASPLFKALE